MNQAIYRTMLLQATIYLKILLIFEGKSNDWETETEEKTSLYAIMEWHAWKTLVFLFLYHVNMQSVRKKKGA